MLLRYGFVPWPAMDFQTTLAKSRCYKDKCHFRSNITVIKGVCTLYQYIHKESVSDNVHPDASSHNLGIIQDCPSPTSSLGTVLWVGAWGQNAAQAVLYFMIQLRVYAIKN